VTPECYHGFDKTGRVAYFGKWGKTLSYEMRMRFNEPDYLQAQEFRLESIAALSRYSSQKLGKEVFGTLLVLDLDGLNLSHRHDAPQTDNEHIGAQLPRVAQRGDDYQCTHGLSPLLAHRPPLAWRLHNFKGAGVGQ